MRIDRINSDADLQRAAEEAGRLLQLIQDHCHSKDRTWADFPQAKVRFPRGYIRTATMQRQRLSFVKDRALKGNLAYTLILSDVILWLSLRTDLWGTPIEMLTKLYAFLIGTLCESITKDYLKGICGKNFKGRNEWLERNGVIDSKLKTDLDWLWETRNKMHLFQLDSLEYANDYNVSCHSRSVRAFRQLISSLSAHANAS